MRFYRIPLAALALLALSTTTSPAAAAQDATTDPSQQSTTVPVVDFAGAWQNHNMMVRIGTDGTADMFWRRGGAGVEAGRATLRVDRVEGRTLYATILTTNYRDEVAAGPFTMTEYAYGVGYLTDGPRVGMVEPYDPRAGITLCGPRFDSAPEWFKSTAPCGA